MIYTSDSLEFLKSRKEFEFDINYSDPPYALGSEIIIRPDGKVDYKKAVDFMSKWDMPTGEYWEQWFKEAYRTLKHGGYLIMFGMDRQLLLFKYYANLAGFVEQQSMYWYYISNFPKATDLSKMIDKNAGAKREIIGQSKGNINQMPDGRKSRSQNAWESEVKEYDITAPSTDLAKKYDGYKYSISPLKQTNETIMVFRKPYKSGSCLHDTLAFENGNNECRCGALNIDGNRVATNEDLARINKDDNGMFGVGNNNNNKAQQMKEQGLEYGGRYPSQTFCDSNTAEVLDKQSDVSKILHKCNYEQEDYDIYNYQPKVSKSERNAGCDEFEESIKGYGNLRNEENNNFDNKKSIPVKNNHPTLKPIALNEKILKLFKTPNDDKIVYPFAGSGSEVIGGIKAGFNNWVGCELSEDYVDIANARIEYWQDQFNKENQTDLLKGE